MEKTKQTIIAAVSILGCGLFAIPFMYAADTANPLVEEMVRLDRVYRDVVSAVAVNDAEGVHRALHAMHGTMEKTHEGVHSGTVRIPKNADRAGEFVRLDKEFHGDLEQLAHAAADKNEQEMLSLTKKLLDGCVNCHRIFRK